MTIVFMRKEKRLRHGRESHVKLVAKLGVMSLQAEDRHGLQQAPGARRHRTASLSEPLEETNSADILISAFWPPEM